MVNGNDNQAGQPLCGEEAVYIPTATYRIQFNGDFPFEAAREHADYFQRLGVSDVYSSPIWRAAKGSLHGYDVIDHTCVNPELGGEEAFKALATDLAARQLGIVVDVVPNHMGIADPNNRLWWDVLENGSLSPYAHFFDVDWRAAKQELHDRVELPILGQQFGICLENGELKTSFTDNAEFRINYYEHELPTDPRTWTLLLRPTLEKLKARLPDTDEDLIEFQSILTALRHLPVREDNPGLVRERHREKEVCKRRLRKLVEANPMFLQVIQETLHEVNGQPGNPQSFDLLEEFLESQNHRLSFWRVAGDEINYRRFFDVNELAAIRVELPDVFDHVHQLIFRLIQEGCIRGLRIDHPDGLLNPPQYFRDLQQGCRRALNTDDDSNSDCAMWVVAEKILEHQERIRADWAVHGTTGYDFLNLLNGIFVDQGNSSAFRRLYANFTGSTPNYSQLKTQCKKLILDISMTGELHTLARRLDRISEQNRRNRDFTLQKLQEALAEFIAAFPFYRTYIRPDADAVDEDDKISIQTAIRRAKRNNSSSDPTVFDFIGTILLMEEQELLSDEQRQERREFVLKLQQITGPVMAKGLEDTAFYREFPLVSINEVGGDPERFGISLGEFHHRCVEQADFWPSSMNATSTHDTKRSEDARARLNVLSEMPRQWDVAIRRWRRINTRYKKMIEGALAPTPHEEYLFYQALLAIWPLYDETIAADVSDRIGAYMIKAAREAKVNTSWVNVDVHYEELLLHFVGKVLEPRNSKFLEDFKSFARTISIRGANNSLGQTLVKLTAPGIPDFYQGAELWDTSLVDPDNRRPVDYKLRQKLLDEVISRQHEPEYLEEIISQWRDGRIKLMVTHKGLAFRRAYAQLYQHGKYVPLEAVGEQKDHLLAYAQHRDGQWALTVVPRLLSRGEFSDDSLVDGDFWRNTELKLPPEAPRSWHNIFTGETVESTESRTVPVSQHLGRFPVALLVSQQ